MINPNELKTVLQTHNGLLEDIDEFKKENDELAKQIEELKSTLSYELGKE